MEEYSNMLLDNPRVINNNRMEGFVIMNVAVSRKLCIREHSRQWGTTSD